MVSIDYTSRNTKAVIVSVGVQTFYFSYWTCIGYAGPSGHWRLKNIWGPTTGRHIKSDFEIASWPIVSEKELLERVAADRCYHCISGKGG